MGCTSSSSLPSSPGLLDAKKQKQNRKTVKEVHKSHENDSPKSSQPIATSFSKFKNDNGTIIPEPRFYLQASNLPISPSLSSSLNTEITPRSPFSPDASFRTLIKRESQPIDKALDNSAAYHFGDQTFQERLLDVTHSPEIEEARIHITSPVVDKATTIVNNENLDNYTSSSDASLLRLISVKTRSNSSSASVANV
eukprot:GHVH01006729.1.p1 GENE.GHVH01006729.1~~GHVH01006729.1.p1  ORF type:complete len:196 (+),score=21.74 GHVH01006729.1:1257-1844(+)